jgi:hypothetical protein
MGTWQEFTEQAPELAAQVRERFEAHRHKTMATIRADGSPRISGTEVALLAGQVYLGGMTGNRRFADLRRDPRLAIHSASEDPDRWTGDAKISGVAVEIVDEEGREAFRAAAGEVPPGPFELFRVEVQEATVVRLAEERDRLVIETWREGAGVRRVERA